MRRATLFSLGLLAAGLVSGCGGKGGVVPVSGTVTVDGTPYANAVVSFQPQGGGNLEPGKGSMGTTGKDGRFELVYGGEKKGAMVGKHRVRISTLPGKGTQEPPNSTGTPDGIVGARPTSTKMEYDPIPVDWNEKSEHTFDVPPGGTSTADFVITTGKKR